MRKRRDTVKVEGRLVNETPFAYLIETGGVRDWVPKSETQYDHDKTFLMPQKIAMEKGFI